MTAFHEQNTALYDRQLKSKRLHFRIDLESGILKSDLPSVIAGATETQDDITTSFGETVSPTPADLTGLFSALLDGSELGDVKKVLSASVISADAALGTVAVTAELTLQGNIMLDFNSDQDITGDDAGMEVVVEYQMK